MRILYVGNFNEKRNGARFYDSNRRLVNGFTRNGHQVYQFSDRDIARSSTWFESRKFGIIPANMRLLETAKQFSPDLVVIGHADQIFSRTLKQIKKALPHVKIAVRNIDGFWQPGNIGKIMARADVADAIFITTAGAGLDQFTRKNNVVSFFPNIVDKSIDVFRAFENEAPTCRVFYGMGNADVKSERFRVSNQLLEAFPEGEIDILGMKGKPAISGISYLERLGASRMGLNLSREEGVNEPLYSSDRMAQYMGNGLLTLIHRRVGFDQIFKEDEMAFYEDFDDLIEKIKYFNAHDDEAREIAENGWRRSFEIFNEQLVAKYIVEVTFREPLSEDYQWPTKLHTV